MLHTGAYVDTDTDIDTDEDANTGADTEAGTDADTGANVGAGVDKDRFFAVFSRAFSSAAGVPCGSLRCLPELCNLEFGNRERATSKKLEGTWKLQKIIMISREKRTYKKFGRTFLVSAATIMTMRTMKTTPIDDYDDGGVTCLLRPRLVL